MYCPNCGSPVGSGISFCPHCGAPLTGGGGGSGGKTGALLYTARRSVWYLGKKIVGALLAVILGAILSSVFMSSGMGILGFIGIVIAVAGGIMLFVDVLTAARFRLEVYDNRIVVKEGLFSTRSRQSIMSPIIGVSVSQSFWGKIFDYGTVTIDKVGKGWDVSTTYIKHPYQFNSFLESLIDSTDYSGVKTFLSD